MFRYILRKILVAILTVFAMATITFFLLKLIPGDPFASLKTSQEIQDLQRAYYGLDKPVIQQYFTYMGNLLQGNLGISMKHLGKNVYDIIAATFPVSAKLGLIAFVFAELLGIAFGIVCAQFKGRWPDYILLLIAVAGIAIPTMVLGPLLRYWLGVKLHVLPSTGWGEARQIIMPAFVLGLSIMAAEIRSMRTSMVGVLSEDFITAARAKGMNRLEIMWHHELKNSLIPILTNMGVTLSGILMGSFIVEKIFLIPGLGEYYVNSVMELDYPLIMGLSIFYGSLLVGMNLIVDILYGLVDPRIRVK